MDFGRLTHAFGNFRGGVNVDTFSGFMQDMLNLGLNAPIYNSLLNALIPVGIALCLMYCLLELMEKVALVQFSAETFIRQMMKFVIAYAIVTNIPSLLRGFSDIVSDFNTTIAGSINHYENFNEIIKLNAERSSVLNALSATFNSLFSVAFASAGFLLNTMAMFSIIGVAIERTLTICIKGALAPIIVPDIYKNGLSSSGIKFLRGLFANYLEATIVLLVVELCCIVVFENTNAFSAAFTMGLAPLFTIIVCLFIVRGSLKRVPQYAQEIMM